MAKYSCIWMANFTDANRHDVLERFRDVPKVQGLPGLLLTGTSDEVPCIPLYCRQLISLTILYDLPIRFLTITSAQ